MAKKTGIDLAIKKIGNSTKLSNALGNIVSRQAIDIWVKTGNVPAWVAPDVMLVSGIKVDKLCPGTNWAAVRNFKAE